MTVYELKPRDLIGNQYHAVEVHQDYDGKPEKTKTFYYVPCWDLTGEPILPLPKPLWKSVVINNYGFRDFNIPYGTFVFRDNKQIWPPPDSKQVCPHCNGDVFPSHFEGNNQWGFCLSCGKNNRP